MKAVVRIGLVLAAVWLQTSFFGAFPLMGVIPNVLLVLVIYAGLIGRTSDAVIMALVGGLLLDMASGPDFGLRMGFYVLSALLIAVLKQAGTDFENTPMVLAATLAGTVMYDVMAISSLLLKATVIPWPTVMRLTLVEVAVNSLLVVALRWPLGWLLGQAEFTFSTRKRARSI